MFWNVVTDWEITRNIPLPTRKILNKGILFCILDLFLSGGVNYRTPRTFRHNTDGIKSHERQAPRKKSWNWYIWTGVIVVEREISSTPIESNNMQFQVREQLHRSGSITAKPSRIGRGCRFRFTGENRRRTFVHEGVPSRWETDNFDNQFLSPGPFCNFVTRPRHGNFDSNTPRDSVKVQSVRRTNAQKNFYSDVAIVTNFGGVR